MDDRTEILLLLLCAILFSILLLALNFVVGCHAVNDVSKRFASKLRRAFFQLVLEGVDVASDIIFTIILSLEGFKGMMIASILTLVATTIINFANWLTASILSDMGDEMRMVRDEQRGMILGVMRMMELCAYFVPIALGTLPWPEGLTDPKHRQGMPSERSMLLFFAARLMEDIPQLVLQGIYLSRSGSSVIFTAITMVFTVLSVCFCVNDMVNSWATEKVVKRQSSQSAAGTSPAAAARGDAAGDQERAPPRSTGAGSQEPARPAEASTTMAPAGQPAQTMPRVSEPGASESAAAGVTASEHHV